MQVQFFSEKSKDLKISKIFDLLFSELRNNELFGNISI